MFPIIKPTWDRKVDVVEKLTVSFSTARKDARMWPDEDREASLEREIGTRMGKKDHNSFPRSRGGARSPVVVSCDW